MIGVRKYRKYPSLFDLVLNMVSLSEKDKAIVIRLSMAGVSKKNGNGFIKKFIENIGGAVGMVIFRYFIMRSFPRSVTYLSEKIPEKQIISNGSTILCVKESPDLSEKYFPSQKNLRIIHLRYGSLFITVTV